MKTWLAIALCVVPVQLHAQPDDDDGPEARAMLPVKLDDLIEVAVRLSPDLARAKLDRSAAADAAIAEQRPQAWVVSSSVQYTRSAVGDRVEAPPFSVVATDELAGSLGLGRNLPTGGSVSVEADLQHATQEYNIVDTLTKPQAQQMSPTGAAASQEFRDASRSAVKLTVKQPLARGFGPAVALAPERKAELAHAEATVKAQLAAEELVRDLIKGYWELAYAAYEVEVEQQAVELGQKQDQLTHEQIRGGAVATSALADVTYAIASRQEALLRAQLEVEKQSLELRRKSGLEIGRRDVVIRPGEPFELPADDDVPAVDVVLERSHVANRKLATIELERKIADVDVAVAADQTKPQLDLQLSGSLIGNGDDAGTALRGISGGDGFEVTAGLSMSFEISGAAGKARDAAAAKRRRLDVDRADLERQLDTGVVAAVPGVTAARARGELADRAIQVAEDSVRTERASFMASRSTNYQVMQRQNELIDARLRRGRAIADYHEAVAQLHFLSGELLDRYRVRVRPRRDP